MKKGYSILTDEELEKLPTKRLLTLKKKVYKHIYWRETMEQESPEHYLARIKRVLATREHVEEK